MTRIFGLVILAAWAGSGCHDENVVATEPSYVQVDRMAIPTVNTVLIPAAKKESYNRSRPANDRANYRADVVNTISALRAAVATRLGPADGAVTAEALADILMPDVVTIDFAQPVTFPNGRDLTDDVGDAVLALVLDRSGLGDGVDGNDGAFLGGFPYLAPPFVLPKPVAVR